MKKKDKKTKKKVAVSKKQISRPAHKKPRPKKYVEAKIPPLPPVSSTTIPITKEAPIDGYSDPRMSDGYARYFAQQAIPPKKTVIVTVELPDGQTEEAFAKQVLTAAQQLKLVSETVLKQKETDESAQRAENLRKLGGTLYKDPGIGLIRRHPYENESTSKWKPVKKEDGTFILEPVTDSTYIRMLAEEKQASVEENNRTHANTLLERQKRAEFEEKQKQRREAERLGRVSKMNEERAKSDSSWLHKLVKWFKQ